MKKEKEKRPKHSPKTESSKLIQSSPSSKNTSPRNSRQYVRKADSGGNLMNPEKKLNLRDSSDSITPKIDQVFGQSEFELILQEEFESMSEFEHESLKEAEDILHEKKESLRLKYSRPMTPSIPVVPTDCRIKLNIGGRRFETYKSTLMNFPSTLLATMLSDRNNEMLKLDLSNELFFDRDPAAFECILNFYRTGKLRVFPGVCVEVLEEEAVFWQLPITSVEDEKFGDKLAIISMGVLRRKAHDSLNRIKKYIFDLSIKAAKEGLQSFSIEFKSQEPRHKEDYAFLSIFSYRELLLHDLLQKNIDVAFQDISTSGQGHSYILVITLWNRYSRLSADRNVNTAITKILGEMRQGVEIKTHKPDHILTVKPLFN